MNDSEKNSKSSPPEGEKDEFILEEDGVGPSELLKKTKEKLKFCEREKMDYLSGWQRAKADLVNARRDMEEEKSRLVKFSEKMLIMEFVELSDSFDRLFQNKESLEKIDKNWQQGIENLRSQLFGILKTRGVEDIKCVGNEFNTAEHESMEEVDVDDKEKDGIVMEEMRKGYKMHGIVIRPTLVKVGKFKGKQ